MGDKEILEAYLNSASKNKSERDIFPHGTKSLLTSVICLRTVRTESAEIPTIEHVSA